MQSAKVDRLFTQLGRGGIGVALAVSALAMSPRQRWQQVDSELGNAKR